MIYVIDTHALVWFLEGNQNLSHKAMNIMLTSEFPIIVPTIVLAEMKYLFDRKRITTAFDDIRKRLYDDERVTIYPLDDLVIDYLPEQLEIHDAVICATCLALQNTLGEEVQLITKDEAIVKSSIVATVW